MKLLTKLRITLAERLAFYREKKNWTQHDLAAATGLTASGIRGYEQKKRWPDPEGIEVMAEALKVRPIDLLTSPEEVSQPTPELALEVIAKAAGINAWAGIREKDKREPSPEVQIELNSPVEAPKEPRLKLLPSEKKAIIAEIINNLEKLDPEVLGKILVVTQVGVGKAEKEKKISTKKPSRKSNG